MCEYEVLISDPKALDPLESLGSDSNRKLTSFQWILAIAEKHLGGPVCEYSCQALGCGSDSGSYRSLRSVLSTTSRRSDIAIHTAEAKIFAKFSAKKHRIRE